MPPHRAREVSSRQYPAALEIGDPAEYGAAMALGRAGPRDPVDQIFPRVSLLTDRLLLRPFESSDALDVHAAWNDEAYLRFVPAGFAAAGAELDHAIKWCGVGVEQWRALGEGVGFAAEPRAGGRRVGHVALFGTDWTAMTTEIHYWTAPWARGRGYATEAAAAIARWALTEHHFTRVALAAVTSNLASRKVAEAAGFRLEGVLRNAALTQAGRQDLSVYSLIPADLAHIRPTSIQPLHPANS